MRSCICKYNKRQIKYMKNKRIILIIIAICLSCNIKAPIVINSDTKCGGQFIAQNQDYPVKYYIYDRLKEKQLVKGEEAEC